MFNYVSNLMHRRGSHNFEKWSLLLSLSARYVDLCAFRISKAAFYFYREKWLKSMSATHI